MCLKGEDYVQAGAPRQLDAAADLLDVRGRIQRVHGVEPVLADLKPNRVGVAGAGSLQLRRAEVRMGVHVLSAQRTVRGYQPDDLHPARDPPRAPAQQVVALDRDRVACRGASRGGGGSRTRTDERQRHDSTGGQHRYRHGGVADQRKTKGTELQDLT